MFDKLGEITKIYNASKMFDVALHHHLNGIYEVGYHCQRRVHHCYADEILTVLRALGESATDATFMQALGIEGYDERFSQLARVQHAFGEQPLICQIEEIRKVFYDQYIEVTTHGESIILRLHDGHEIAINDENAEEFFVFFLPEQLEIFCEQMNKVDEILQSLSS